MHPYRVEHHYPVTEGIFSAKRTNVNTPTTPSIIFNFRCSLILSLIEKYPTTRKGIHIMPHYIHHLGDKNPSIICMAKNCFGIHNNIIKTAKIICPFFSINITPLFN